MSSLTNFTIPQSWKLVSLKKLGVWSGGGTPSKSKPQYWQKGTVPWVSPKDMKTERISDSEDHITKEAVSQSATSLIMANSVLVVTRSGILRHTLPVAVNTVPVTVNQDLKALTPQSGILAEYVAWALRALSRNILNTCSKQGTTVNSIETAKLLSFKIPLAPIEQQKSIVAEIEKQFSRLDEAVASLKRTKANLKRYKAAVLKAAVEGKLTKDWRKQHPDVEPASKLLERILAERHCGQTGKKTNQERLLADACELPELPHNWVWATSLQVFMEVKDGTHDTPQYVETGVPFITQKHIKPSGLVFDDFKLISQGDHEQFYKRSNPERGDILVSMIGVNRGQSCIVNTGAVFSIKNVGLFKPYHALTSNRFFQIYFSSLVGQSLILKTSKGGAQPFIGLSELRAWPIPLPPLLEQKEIVAEAERRLSLIEELEATVQANLTRADRLRQSVLQSAFSGRLNGPTH